MRRLGVAIVVTLVANAIGLALAALLLDDMTVGAVSFVTAVLVFSAVEVVALPLVARVGKRYAGPLASGSALVATLLGLVVTVVITDDLRIRGVSTWILAAVVVWLAATVAALVIPRVVPAAAADRRRRPEVT